MAKCSASTLTSFVQRVMIPQLFVQNVGKTSRLRHTMPIVNVKTVQQDIVLIAKNVVSKAEEKIGQDQFTRQSLRQMLKPAKSVMLIDHLQNFMQTAVLRMAQRNTVVGARVVCLQGQSKTNQSCTQQKLKDGRQAPKISFLASLTTPQNASKILVLTLILSIFINFMSNSKGAALCLELK